MISQLRGGGGTTTPTPFGKMFAENYMKMKEIGPKGLHKLYLESTPELSKRKNNWDLCFA